MSDATRRDEYETCIAWAIHTYKISRREAERNYILQALCIASRDAKYEVPTREILAKFQETTDVSLVIANDNVRAKVERLKKSDWYPVIRRLMYDVKDFDAFLCDCIENDELPARAIVR